MMKLILEKFAGNKDIRFWINFLKKVCLEILQAF